MNAQPGFYSVIVLANILIDKFKLSRRDLKIKVPVVFLQITHPNMSSVSVVNSNLDIMWHLRTNIIVEPWTALSICIKM